jgi:prepilin-type processing-associated H-X9-DG protein
LLVVIAIIAILAALLLPSLGKAKLTAQSSACRGNLRQCGSGEISYSVDFDSWLVSSSVTNNNPAPVPTSSCRWATRQMTLGYSPAKGGSYNGYQNVGVWTIPLKNVFSCPILPPPPSYKASGTVYPLNGLLATTETVFGLRTLGPSWYYPGEKLDPTGTLLRIESAYLKAPYMIDNAGLIANGSGSGTSLAQRSSFDIGQNSSCTWCGGAHLRHSRRANAFFIDGHVGSLGSAEALEIKKPGAGTLSNESMAISY